MSTIYYDPILNMVFIDHGLIVEHDGSFAEGETLMIGDNERKEFFKDCIELGEF